jgi:hypothetical protein
MKLLHLTEKVDSVLRSLDSVDSISFDLGTPELPEVDAVQDLVTMGPPIVPLLLERVFEDGPKKRIAYTVLILHRIGDPRAAEPLQKLRARYQEHENKDEWDYAVIGQCNLAIERLQK